MRAIALLAAYFLAIHLLLSRVQIRIWNYSNALDLLVMVVLIGPFLATRWALPSRARATRWAWYLCAVMAIDVLAFAIGTFAPTGGHPSIEALLSLALGLLKTLLVPLALGALLVASLQRERWLTLVLAVTCLIGETLYTVLTPDHPFRWLARAAVT